MKKVLLILTFLLYNLLYAQAQNEKNANKRGFKGGGNFSNFNGADAGNSKLKTGFHLGAFINFPLGNIALQQELLLCTRGARWEESNVDASTNLLYIDAPLMLKFYFHENFNLHFGGQIGYLLSASNRMDPAPEDHDKDVSDQYKKWDYGPLAGMEFTNDFGFLLGIRYYYGLTEIGEDYDSSLNVSNKIIISEIEAKDYQNSMFQVYLGVEF